MKKINRLLDEDFLDFEKISEISVFFEFDKSWQPDVGQFFGDELRTEETFSNITNKKQNGRFAFIKDNYENKDNFFKTQEFYETDLEFHKRIKKVLVSLILSYSYKLFSKRYKGKYSTFLVINNSEKGLLHLQMVIKDLAGKEIPASEFILNREMLFTRSLNKLYDTWKKLNESQS